MKTVHELEAKRNQEGDTQEQERNICCDGNARRLNVGVYAIDGKKQAGRQQQNEDDCGGWRNFLSRFGFGDPAPASVPQYRT